MRPFRTYESILAVALNSVAESIGAAVIVENQKIAKVEREREEHAASAFALLLFITDGPKPKKGGWLARGKHVNLK